MIQQRIEYLDLVKLFTIYLVIIGHVIAMMVNGYVVGEKLNSLIYSFHMPLFMLLSGFFVSSKSEDIPIINIVTKKAKQLLLPSITCTAICLLYLWLVREHVNIRVEIIGNSWFLKTLFVYYILFCVLRKTGLNIWLLMPLSCGVLFILPHASSLQANLLFPYFWGGYLIKRYKLLEKLTFSWSYAILSLLLFAGLYTLQRYWNIPNYVEINIITLQSQWYLILIRYCVAFAGSIATILTISIIYKSIKKYPITTKCARYGKWTLGIYILQTILVVNVFPDAQAWNVESEWLLDFVIVPLLSIAFLIVCIYLIHLISKNKTLDLIFFGGQYYNS